MKTLTSLHRKFLLSLYDWHRNPHSTFELDDGDYELVYAVVVLGEYDKLDASFLNIIRNKYKSEYHRIIRVHPEIYNPAELRHIAMNYAIHCLKGYEGNFEDWFKDIASDWRDIANQRK